jgi:hypothetical protein
MAIIQTYGSTFPRNGRSRWAATREENSFICKSIIDHFEVLAHRYTEWEANFTKSLIEQRNKNRPITTKQAQVSRKIIDNVDERIHRRGA